MQPSSLPETPSSALEELRSQEITIKATPKTIAYLLILQKFSSSNNLERFQFIGQKDKYNLAPALQFTLTSVSVMPDKTNGGVKSKVILNGSGGDFSFNMDDLENGKIEIKFRKKIVVPKKVSKLTSASEGPDNTAFLELISNLNTKFSLGDGFMNWQELLANMNTGDKRCILSRLLDFNMESFGPEEQLIIKEALGVSDSLPKESYLNGNAVLRDLSRLRDDLEAGYRDMMKANREELADQIWKLYGWLSDILDPKKQRETIEKMVIAKRQEWEILKTTLQEGIKGLILEGGKKDAATRTEETKRPPKRGKNQTLIPIDFDKASLQPTTVLESIDSIFTELSRRATDSAFKTSFEKLNRNEQIAACNELKAALDLLENKMVAYRDKIFPIWRRRIEEIAKYVSEEDLDGLIEETRSFFAYVLHNIPSGREAVGDQVAWEVRAMTLQDKLNHLTALLDDKIKEATGLKRDMEVLQEENSKLEKQKGLIGNELTKAGADKDILQNKLDQAVLDQGAINARLTEITKQRDEAEAKHRKAQEDLGRINRAKVKTEAGLEAARQIFEATKIARDGFSAQLNVAIAEQMKAESIVRNLQGDLAIREGELGALRGELKAIGEEKQGLEVTLLEKAAEIDAKRIEIAGLQEVQRQKETRIIELDGELNESQLDREEKSRQLTEIKAGLLNAEQKIDELQETIECLYAESSRADLELLEENQKLAFELTDARNVIDGLNKKVGEMGDEAEELNKGLNGARDDLRQKNADLEKTEKVRKILAKQKEDLETKLNGLRDQLREEEKSHRATKTKLTDLQRSHDDLKIEKEEAASDRDQKSTQLAAAEKEIGLLRQQEENQKQRIDGLMEEIKHLGDEREVLISQIRSKEGIIEKLQKQIENQSKNMENLYKQYLAKLEEWSEERKRLQEELTKKSNELQESWSLNNDAEMAKTSMQRTIQEMQQQLRDSELQWELKKQELITEQEKTLMDMRRDLSDQYQAAVLELDQKFQEQLAAAVGQHQKDIIDLQNKLAAEKQEEIDRLNKVHREELASLKQHWDEVVAKLEQMSNDEINRLKTEHENRLNDLHNQQVVDIKRIEKEMADKRTEETDQLNQDHQKAVEVIIKQKDAEINRLLEDFSQQMGEFAGEAKRGRVELWADIHDARYEKSRQREAKDKLAEEADKLATQVTNLELSIGELKKLLFETEEKRDESDREKNRITVQYQALIKSLQGLLPEAEGKEMGEILALLTQKLLELRQRIAANKEIMEKLSDVQEIMDKMQGMGDTIRGMEEDAKNAKLAVETLGEQLRLQKATNSAIIERLVTKEMLVTWLEEALLPHKKAIEQSEKVKTVIVGLLAKFDGDMMKAFIEICLRSKPFMKTLSEKIAEMIVEEGSSESIREFVQGEFTQLILKKI